MDKRNGGFYKMSVIDKYINLCRLRKHAWLKREQLEQIQNKMLGSVIRHAYKNVPLYREKFKKAGIRPEDIRSVKDLVKVPMITKKELAENFPGRILAKGTDVRKCHVYRTSGSTGTPLTVVESPRYDDYEKAVTLRANFECGQNLFDRWFIITSPAHINQRFWFQKFGILNTKYVSLFSTTQSHIRALREFKPKIIDGYASSIWLMAREILENRIPVKKPKLIFTTSEMLDEKMRKDITDAFGVEPLDQFGCVEVARTAWECPEHCGYHLDIDAVATEFVKDNEHVSPGEKGEIVYTSLYNYEMPFIRYRVGDIGVPSDEKCSCGRGLPLMKSLMGRADDFVKTPDGRIFSPIIGTIMMRDIKGIRQFRIIQEKIDKLTVEIEKDNNFSEQTFLDVKKEIKKRLGEDIDVKTKVVDKIERSKSGKLRSVVSKVKI
jgi:phenylacetate-CoA ligase